ncbi:MAG: maltose alpha-D-glucosyltransferase [Chitinophagaceae bacterium]
MATFTEDKYWYKDAIIYELHIKAFKDSNGDGMGDFTGLIEKLDYLQELGVTAIWVLPFYPSPLKDDGYDIADYYSINPRYGNIEQFKLLLEESHKRKLKVITELVLNHTSDQHQWFQKARRAPKGSPERDFYVWSDDPEKYKDVRIIFQDFEASNWSWDPVAQQYYWHRFFHHQPDLNFDNPLVQEEVFKVLDYWCAMGVDGFRLDAVPYLFERDGTNGENLPETHAFLKKLRKHIDDHFPRTVFLAEANMWPEDSASYFGDGDECHMNYHFPVMPRMFMSLQMEDRYPITDIFDQTPAIPESCQWAIFLRNHDELTLEMVTDEERDYMYKVYAKDPKAKINLGIRHRLAPLMENNRRKIELMNSLLFSLQGTPVVYYGDEIGMGDNFYLGDRDGVRTPMQWSPDRNAGFSTANPQSLYLPTILDPEYHYETVNVETQRKNTSSLFWFMKRIINMRKKYKAFSRGDLTFLHVENPKVLAFTRTHENEVLFIIVNLSKHSQPAEVDLIDYKGYNLLEVFSKNHFPVIKPDAPYFFTLAPHSFHWFALEKVHEHSNEDHKLSLLKVNVIPELFSGASSEHFQQDVLIKFFLKAKWFGNKNRKIFSFSILDYATIPVEKNEVYFLLIEVAFESGLPETYHLPVIFLKDEPARKIYDYYPESVVAEIDVNLNRGILCDALFVEEVQQDLLKKMAAGYSIAPGSAVIHFEANDIVKNYAQMHSFTRSRVYSIEKAHTSITYDSSFFLKMYRKVDLTVNPDLEIIRYLSIDKKFEHVPAFTGSIEWKYDKGTVVLGMMQMMIQNHGDGRIFMLDRINNYIERVLANKIENYNPDDLKGTLVAPASFDRLPASMQEVLGSHAAEQAELLGKRTAELHLMLASDTHLVEFLPEEYSLHYQRSLYSSMQALVRETFQLLEKNNINISETLKHELEAILPAKENILAQLKRIYQKKLDVWKIRIHGKYHLKQVLYTGRDVSITNFGGRNHRSYSERRLKRSPLRDVASMIRSFYYVAHEGFINTNHVQKEDLDKLLPFANFWAHYMSGFFIKSYLKEVEGSPLIPKEKEDLQIMLETFLIEFAMQDLNKEISTNSQYALVPIQLMKKFASLKEMEVTY